MSDIYKYFAIVLFSLVCNSLFCDEPEDHKYISVLDKPFFSFTSSERQITLEINSNLLIQQQKRLMI